MHPSVTEHVTLHGKNLCNNVARASGAATNMHSLRCVCVLGGGGGGLGTYEKYPDFRLAKVSHSTLICENLCLHTDCDELQNPSLALHQFLITLITRKLLIA